MPGTLNTFRMFRIIQRLPDERGYPKGGRAFDAPANSEIADELWYGLKNEMASVVSDAC